MRTGSTTGHSRHSADPVTDVPSRVHGGRTDWDRSMSDLSGHSHHAIHERWVLGPTRQGRFRARRGRGLIGVTG